LIQVFVIIHYTPHFFVNLFLQYHSKTQILQKIQFSKGNVRCVIKVAKEGDILNTTEQIHQEDLQRLKSLRYMDDDFMTVCLADNFEGVELILRIVLGREDIKIKSVRTQELMKNLQGRSVALDVHAVDSANKEFDVEIQRQTPEQAQKEQDTTAVCWTHIY